jgi:hypothetical protein
VHQTGHFLDSSSESEESDAENEKT